MTFSLLRTRPDGLRMFQLVLAFVWLLAAPALSQAARVTVVLSTDSAPYQEVYQVIRAKLDDSGHTLGRLYAANLSGSALADARLVVAVGVGAAEAVAAQSGRTPVLAVLVPRAWYQKAGQARLSDGGRRTVSALYLDQPFERQVELIRLAFPDARRVGVLLSVEQRGLLDEIGAAVRARKLSLVHALLDEDERLAMPLETVLADADLLLAVPDPRVINSNTAQSLFLTSYRYRDPVLGYSRSLTRAGALLSLHSSPSQIGRQTAEWLLDALGEAAVRLPTPSYPAYFGVSVNEQVARSLGFVVPPEGELEKRLGGGR
ncbi:MAG: ABC transporter substrate binding protein [Pseudomonadota bacterium]